METNANHNSNRKSDWLTRVLVTILIGIVGWLWHSMDNRLVCVENRLRSVELSQARILQKLELTPVFPAAAAHRLHERQGGSYSGPYLQEIVDYSRNGLGLIYDRPRMIIPPALRCPDELLQSSSAATWARDIE